MKSAIKRTLAGVLVAVNTLVSTMGCYKDNNSLNSFTPIAQEEYSPQEQSKAEQAQFWYQKASQDNVISPEELNDLETRVEIPQKNGKQKSINLTELSSVNYTNGNVNNSEKTDIFDLIDLIRGLSGSQNPDYNYDVDGNDRTDIFDLIALLRILGGNTEPQKYHIHGKVKGIHAGDPEYCLVPNAIVSFKDKNWNLVKADTADANGNYSVSLPAGDYNMCISAEDYWKYPQFESKNPYVKWYYFETDVNSDLEKDGVIFRKDVELPYVYDVLKGKYSENRVPVAKLAIKNPTIWIQNHPTDSTFTNLARRIATQDFPDFQGEIQPQIVSDSTNAMFKLYFEPFNGPHVEDDDGAYKPDIDWDTNTVTGGRIWIADYLTWSESRAGALTEETSQCMMNLHDTFRPEYIWSRFHQKHDNFDVPTYNQKDRDNLGTIYGLIPVGW